MSKKILCGLLTAALLWCLALPVFAEEAGQEAVVYSISSREEFLVFAENCRLDSFSQGLTVSLDADIDLAGAEFKSVPIFCGTFLGNGHTIRGLILKGEGSYQGLFRYLTDTALVENLKIEGLLIPEGSGSQTGALAGSNAGTIRNCSFNGTVSGSEQIGGLVGSNTVSGIIEKCSVAGFVSGRHFVGGIAGKNSGVIRECKNDAQVNATVQQNSVALSDITLESLTTSEASNTVTDIGGIAGHSTGVIRSCVNRADVGYRHMGYNIGGIAGTQSGYMADCINYGPVMGRKEIGGIVGQMEPTTLIEYKEDVLQILERQLNSLGSIVNDTAGNIQGGAQGMYAQVEALQDSVSDAEDALLSLIPDEEGLPDMDTVQAAENALSSSMADMTDTLRGMSAVTESMVGSLSNNLHAIENQMNAMRTTLGNADETLGGSIRDISDEDTEDNLSGKVERCINYADILADLNAGGIAGAMAVENDLDHEEDISVTGSNSLNFSSELRCVIKDCRNKAVVTVGKQNAGGVVGWQSLGLVKNSYNSGSLDAAEYAGGIAGLSEGYIRSCGAKCFVSAGRHAGGIAGSGSVVTNCLSMVQIKDAAENAGAILGNRKMGYHEEETPVAGNYYLVVGEDNGGIDGISYSTVAEPMTLEEFLTQENLPELFRTVNICFRYESGGESRFAVIPGESFPREKIPQLPPKAGHSAAWKDMEEADLEQVLFDLTFEAEYTAYDGVLSSGGENGKPLLLIQGGFTSDSVLEIADYTDAVPLEEGQTLLKAKTFSVKDAQYLTSLRLCIYDWEAEDQRLLIRGKDGAWRQPETVQDGSYLVAELLEGDNAVAQIQITQVPWTIVICVGVLLAVLLLVVIRKRKK